MQIKAAVAIKPNTDLEIQTLELDEPNANEVLVKIVSTGFCHTDIVGRSGATTPLPVVLRHEGAGVVQKVGANVTDVKVGDHVVLSFSYCGHCYNCTHNHQGLCENFNQLNFEGKTYDDTHRLHLDDGTPVSVFFGQSSFSTYVTANVHNIVKVDQDVDLNLLGPLGCGMQTGAGTVLNYIKPAPEDAIAVFGVGAVGLAAIMAAKIAGIKHIIAINRNGNHLDLAKELGATETINNTAKDPVKAIKEIVPRGVTYAIDTTGNTGVIKSAIDSLATAGECVLLGVGGDITLNLMDDILSESKKISGVVEGDSNPQEFIPQLVKYYKQGKFPLDKLVKYYDFADINQIIADSTNGKVIKPIIKIDPELAK